MEIGKLYKISNLDNKPYLRFIQEEGNSEHDVSEIGCVVIPNNSIIMITKIIKIGKNNLIVFLYKQHMLATICLEYIVELKYEKL